MENCECGRENAGADGRCRLCRMGDYGRARRKYHFSDELRDELRRAYCHKKRELTAALDKLVRRTGWPRHAFKVEATRLGLTTMDHRRGWTPIEVEYLREHVGSISVRRIAANLKRSVASVQARAEKLHLSRRPADGYSSHDLELAFGESNYKVRRWMERGLLGKVHRDGGCRVTDKNVSRFLLNHSAEYDLRRVDQEWYKGTLFARGGLIPGRGGK